MLNISLDLEKRKEMEAYVDHCELKTPEEVARLFLEYTLLIWDYLLVGRIADFYNEDIVMNHAGGVTVQGLESVYSGTLSAVAECVASMPDNQTLFVDIFAEGTPEDGYHSSFRRPRPIAPASMTARSTLLPRALCSRITRTGTPVCASAP